MEQVSNLMVLELNFTIKNNLIFILNTKKVIPFLKFLTWNPPQAGINRFATIDFSLTLLKMSKYTLNAPIE